MSVEPVNERDKTGKYAKGDTTCAPEERAGHHLSGVLKSSVAPLSYWLEK